MNPYSSDSQLSRRGRETQLTHLNGIRFHLRHATSVLPRLLLPFLCLFGLQPRRLEGLEFAWLGRRRRRRPGVTLTPASIPHPSLSLHSLILTWFSAPIPASSSASASSSSSNAASLLPRPFRGVDLVFGADALAASLSSSTSACASFGLG
jgi:hypothetical protein